MRRLFFSGKAASFVRSNGGRFDVVDALIGSLSSSKKKLGFNGLFVARSVGSHRLYDEFERSIQSRWPQSKRGTFAGRLFYSGLNRWLMTSSDAAIRDADMVNVPNTEEASFLRERGAVGGSVIVQPYGLTDENRRALFMARTQATDRLRQKRISFVGMWGPRKGSRVWGEVVRRVRQKIPDAEFVFLGTMVPPAEVMNDIGAEHSNCIRVIPEFEPNDLPRLLSDCAVGAFPSYVEGFGLAILEQLAAGIPTVAFDQGGPRDIIQPTMPGLLVPTGDVEAFANGLVRILKLDHSEYERLVHLSAQTAERYLWSSIARNTLEQYRSALGSAYDASVVDH
jgi:glycosyltransferase involved in cell wall biosynthesis